MVFSKLIPDVVLAIAVNKWLLFFDEQPKMLQKNIAAAVCSIIKFSWRIMQKQIQSVKMSKAFI